MSLSVDVLRGAGHGRGQVDHRLARQHLINEYKRGRLSQDQVCDAHPELIRAAKNVGTVTSTPCFCALEAISEPDERGMRTVMCIINGQLRPVLVRDRGIATTVPTAEKADRTNPEHVAAPFAGVITVGVAAGDEVAAGQTVATIEAMKMEAAITAPNGGKVSRVAVSQTAQVEGGDLLMVIS